MEEILADYKARLDILEPEVKRKAIEITLQLLKQEEMDPAVAVEQGIKEAEEWYFDLS